jgi:putative aminopeptidase FrvX
MRDQSLEFLKELVNTPSPSGYEQRVAKLYRDYAEPAVLNAAESQLHREPVLEVR